MSLRLALGVSDFAHLRRDGYTFVDKSGLVAEVTRSNAQVVLLPRPRRFGKTLNLSMLRYWFERSEEDRASLFAGLSVMEAGDDVAAHFQRHPVVFLTFKDVKEKSGEACRGRVALLLAKEVERLRWTWEKAAMVGQAGLNALEVEALNRLATETASEAQLDDALRLLTRALHLATGEQTVLLIDEYDTPIHAAWSGSDYGAIVGLFRNLLSGGLKDNASLYRGVLTGILRVAKESIFSGLNNVIVHSLLVQRFSEWFGFSESEVERLCELSGRTGGLPAEQELSEIRQWYNGYRFGGRVMYNPWSVLCYLSSPEEGCRPFWVQTSSDDILRTLLVEGGLRLQDDLTTLLEGGTIVRAISEDVQLRDLRRGGGAVWSFLLLTGYLKAAEVRRVDGDVVATLAIPNREVRWSYQKIFRGWMEQGLGGPSEVDALGRALLSGDEAGFRVRFQRLLLESLSYFDLGGRTPEAVYQAFLVGLLVHLQATHVVDTNRESGFGRYDVCVRSRQPGGPGAVVELKVIDEDGGETPEIALEAALRQVREKEYATTLRQAGARPVWLWAAVFDGKRVRVRVEEAGCG